MGGAATGLLVAVAKLVVVAPRPHLLEVCGSEGLEACEAAGVLNWAPEQVCEGGRWELHEALRAFPSYHATLAAYRLVIGQINLCCFFGDEKV